MISIHLLHCSNRSGNFKASQEKTFTELWLGKDCFEKWNEFFSFHNQFWVLQKWKSDETCLFFRKHLLTLILQSSSAGAVGFWGLHGQWHGRGIPELSMTAIQTAPLSFLPAAPLELRAWALLSKLCSRSLHLYLFSSLYFPPKKVFWKHWGKCVSCLFKSSSHLYILWILVPGGDTNKWGHETARVTFETPRSWRRTAITSASSPTFQRPVGLVGTFQQRGRISRYVEIEDGGYMKLWNFVKIWKHRFGTAVYGNLSQSMAICNVGEWNLFHKFQLMVWHGQQGTGFGGEWGWQGDTWHLLLTDTRYWDIQILGFS